MTKKKEIIDPESEEILAIQDLEPFPLSVPRWNRTITVRPLSPAEFRAISQGSVINGKLDPIVLRVNAMIVGSVKPKFVPSQATRLAGKNWNAVNLVGLSILAGRALTEKETAQ